MTSIRTHLRRATLATTAAAAAFVLASCGSDKPAAEHDMGAESPSGSAAAAAGATGHNSADITFAKDMIQHHRQAVEMAALATSRAGSQDVKDLASKIQGAQDPEIEEMSGWLTAWGEDVPADMSGMGHDMSAPMPGMMSAGDMDTLKKASGATFDKKFLAMMVDHHEGAVTMGKTEKAGGKYGPATRLAADVVTAQTTEIAQMNKMLGKTA
ncbi:DUF305 domain-containing protein [Streptomyces sp. NPDC046821]|uniref:DUF305 domain-containing protein n=1 Tax=Streptomyces sp. NPDC046821 TaxID=3154702 RepID=UPI0033DA6FAA